MFSAMWNKMLLRKATVLGCSLGLLLTTFWSSALAGDDTGNSAASHTLVNEGSTPTHRTQVDYNGGQVYIYAGGSFVAGTHIAEFQYIWDFNPAGNTTGYITPLLFERSSVGSYTIYTVVGISKGFEVTLNTAPQAIPFHKIEGIAVPTNSNFTFGYVNAIVNPSGVQLAASSGTVDMDNPADPGEGVAGAGTTNDWSVTNIGPNPNVALGTTFGAPGSGADYTFYGSYRTYSARAIGVLPAQ